MRRFIKNINDRYTIEFDNGKIDDWCVYLTRFNKLRYAPKDVEYFTFFHKHASVYGCSDKVYSDFVTIYERTTSTLEQEVLMLISSISGSYKMHSEEMDIWFTVIYAGMVAEENKAYAKLKKRIKRLGMHQLLVEGFLPEVAANFSRDKKWQTLDRIMVEKGF